MCFLEEKIAASRSFCSKNAKEGTEEEADKYLRRLLSLEGLLLGLDEDRRKKDDGYSNDDEAGDLDGGQKVWDGQRHQGESCDTFDDREVGADNEDKKEGSENISSENIAKCDVPIPLGVVGGMTEGVTKRK